MATTPNPLQPDPTATGNPTPKSSGFWGVLRNRILPSLGPAMSQVGSRMAMNFGTPQEAAGAERGLQQDVINQQLARQHQFDIPALAEANVQAEIAKGTAPDVIANYHSAAATAAKRASLEPGNFAELQRLKEMEATAPITGLMRLSEENQPSATPPPSQIPTAPPSTPGTPPVPTTPNLSAAMPAPQEILQAQLSRMMGTPVTDKDPTPSLAGDGTYSYKRRNPYTGIVVGEQTAAGPAARLLRTVPAQLQMYFKAAGINPLTASPEEVQKVLDAANTSEQSKTGIHWDKDVNGNIVATPFTSTTTTRKGQTVAPTKVPTNESQTTPGTASAPTKPQMKPRRGGAFVGQGQQVMGPGGVPLHAPLSQGAKNTLYQVDSAQNLIGDPKDPNSLVSQLTAMQDKGSLWDAGKQRAAWEEYSKLGIVPSNVDPVMAKLLPIIAQVQIIGGMAYLKGIRNQKYIAQIQQHVPDPTKDTPELMVSKLQNLQQTLPLLKQAIYESEGVGAPPNISPVAPPTSNVPSPSGGGFAAWKASRGK